MTVTARSRAFHEAGHAVVARHHARHVANVTTANGGRTRAETATPPNDVDAVIAWAGVIAAARACPGEHSDEHTVNFGHVPGDCWRVRVDSDWSHILDAVGDDLDRALLLRSRAAAVVAHVWPQIEVVAAELLERGTLDGDDLDALLAE